MSVPPTDPGPVPPTDPGPAVIGAALRSTDLDRSIKFYTTGLGMVVAGKINLSDVTEVFLAFKGKVGQPGILIFRDDTPDTAAPVDLRLALCHTDGHTLTVDVGGLERYCLRDAQSCGVTHRQDRP